MVSGCWPLVHLVGKRTGGEVKMQAIPLTLKEANEFIKKYHRHNKPVQGYKFAIGAVKDGKLVGVAVVGRPVARNLDDGLTAEITRVCTDGTKNANSFLYARCKKICQLMGYKRVITYTLEEESGASLRAIGAKVDGEVKPTGWDRPPNRKRKEQDVYFRRKKRWKLL